MNKVGTNYRLTSSFVFFFYSFEVCMTRGSIVGGTASCCERGREGEEGGRMERGERGGNEGGRMHGQMTEERERGDRGGEGGGGELGKGG